jgi:chromosome segregation ATPase
MSHKLRTCYVVPAFAPLFLPPALPGPMLKKKEKLEQMRELGRGGLSKGLHFLRAAAANASLENGEASAASSSAADEGGGANSANSSKMTYEELLALSMKLTRQNKLMKAQYQKNQSKLAAAASSDADARALKGFLERDVGLDVAACVGDNSASGGTIDVEVLKERYRILSELKQKELLHQESKPAPVESVNLLELSPVTTDKKPGYEEIDLLGDNAVKDSQLEQAMQQVERMREQLRRGAEQTQALERKLAERDQQQEAARRALGEENMMLEQKVLEVEKAQSDKEREWKEQWEQQSKLVQQLKEKEGETERDADHEEELLRLAEMKRELEKRIREMSDELDAGAKEREAEQVQAAEALAKVQQEKEELAERLQQQVAACTAPLESAKADNVRLQEEINALQQAASVSASGAADDEVKEKITAALAALQAELEAAKAENARLQEQVHTLQTAPPSGGTEDEAQEEVTAALEAQQLELEAAKEKNARFEEQIEALQQAASSSSSAAEKVESEEALTSLRAEVGRLQGLLDAKGSDDASLLQELATLKEHVQKLQDEASQKDTDHAADAALMQELERVKLESAEHVHEAQSLQKKLHAADERLAKATAESEATDSLVEALKEDTSRLADQVAQLEQKQTASDKEIGALTKAKRELEEQQEKAREAKATMEKQLEEERAYWTSKLENLITDSDAANTKTEALEAELRDKEKQVTKMAASQTSMTSELMELQKQVSSMREDLVMAAEGLEAHATKAEENERRYVKSEKEAAALKTQLEEMREKHHENFEMLRQEKEAELERVHTERRTLLTEKKELSRAKDELQARCKSLERELEAARKHEEELETSLGEQTFQVGNLSVDLAETKKSLSDRMALATRLQTENMGMAGKLAEQVALIEGALRDASNSKAAQQQMETQVQAAKNDVQRMKQSETQAKQDLENMQRELLKQEEGFQREREEAKEGLRAAVENEKLDFRRELERLEAESKHKSKLALQVVLEKEKEIARLSARLNELEEDVRSGGADNRKILEFAQLQAKREAEAREQAAQMQALSQQLEEAHRELQELREDKRRHAEELTAMLQNQRRDGVNMEYLKNVVVQYMSFRPGSSQQSRLVPVLTTLLQFTAADIKEIKHAARRGNSWTSWGSSDAALDYKPIVIGAGHRHPMAPPSSTQDSSGRRSPLGRMGSAPVPRVSPPSNSPPEPSRASSFFIPSGSGDEPADPSAESADF